ncbi:calmodulin-A-like isoform X2 [Corticium candelabrum]|uniref:calmodulin-A-like isoform X2 n=1 Tax=Corticium candelabrum TaxID=121492 RepID=UPI002E26975B|nr:calmodulin-A-like isoform X2 [Corticium candelabrum]
MAQGSLIQQRGDARAERSGEVKDVFELFSKDKDKNLLMPGDLQMALQCVGIKQSDRDNLEKKLKEESGGDDNPIQYRTFDMLVGDMLESGAPQQSEIIDAFKVFDREGNGYISAAEIKHLLVGLPDDLDEVESRIQDQFVDGDGLINYQEFVRAINEMASNKQ